MAAISQGWLPYGSSDASVVLQHPLTSLPVTGALFPYSAITAQGGSSPTPRFDPVKGFLPSSFDNTYSYGISCQGCTLSTALQTALNNGGQVSFEIETQYVCAQSASTFSVGFSPNGAPFGNTFPFQFGVFGGPEQVMVGVFQGSSGITPCGMPAMGNNSQGYWWRDRLFTTTDAPNTNAANFSSASGVGAYNSYRTIASGGRTGQAHSWGKGPFTRVNIGIFGPQNGGLMLVAVNGLIQMVGQRATNIGGTGWINSLLIGAAGSGSVPFYIRNLQVSSAIPAFQSKPGFSRIHILGDSTCFQDGTDAATIFGAFADNQATQVIRQAFNAIGYQVSIFTSNNSGCTFDDANGAFGVGTLFNWKDSVIPAFRGNAALATPPAGGIPWPDVLVLQAGINDFHQDGGAGTVVNAGRMLLSMQKLVNYYMFGTYAATAQPLANKTPIKRIIFTTPLSPINDTTSGPGAPAPGPQALGYRQGPSNPNYQIFQTILSYQRTQVATWWNGLYPSLVGRISCADCYSAYGGDSFPYRDTTGSPPQVSTEGVHQTFSVNGQLLGGQAIAAELLRTFFLG